MPPPRYFIERKFPLVGLFAATVAPGSSGVLSPLKVCLSKKKGPVLLYMSIFLNAPDFATKIAWDVERRNSVDDKSSVINGPLLMNQEPSVEAGAYNIPFYLVDTTIPSPGKYTYTLRLFNGS